jgi:glycosyltransferase involved in cell wall biosynthesis
VHALIDYRPALRERTGVGEYAHELARALVRQLQPADQLTLFSSSWKDRLPPDVIPGARVVDARVPVRVLNLAWHRLEWPPVERFAGTIDVAHAMHPLLIPARDAAQIVTIHDLYFLDRPENTTAEIRRDYPSLVAAHAQRADAVIVNSDYTSSQVQSRLQVPAARITVCRPGAPAWHAQAPRPSPARAGHVLFVGTLEPRKNVGLLLRAYQRVLGRMLVAPPLVLAGRVTEAGRPLLDELDRAPLAGHARHVGFVNDAERQRLYREAALLVLPSFDEGFGIPAVEAMTMGVPVVASNRGAFPEVIGDAGLLVDPEDEAGVAAAIERILTDTAFAQRCAAEGMKRASQFSWDASAAVLLDAYAAAVERRRARS